MRPGYRVDVVTLAVEEGLDLWGLLAVPAGAGRRPAVLITDPRLRSAAAPDGPELDPLAREGRVVLALELRGALLESELPPRPTLLGPYAPLYRRASVVGRNLVGLRAEDVLHALDVLAARADVDPTRIEAFGQGSFGVPLLHAAVLDERISRLALQETPVSYRAFLDHPVHRGLPEILVPGVLRHYDIDDLMRALSPRPVALVNPVDAVGRPLRRDERQRYLGTVLPEEGAAGLHVHVLRRDRGDPLRWE
jgi:hypothetical protein